MPRKRELERRKEKLTRALGEMPPAERATLFRLAGYNETKLVKLLQDAVGVLETELGQMKVTRVTVLAGGGRQELREFNDEDTAARHRAAVELLTIIGAYPSKNAGGSSTGPVQINISLRAMDEHKPVVIEATATQVPAE